MVINWTNIAVQDLKEFKQITKMIKPEEYIIRLVTYVDSLIKFPRLGRIYVYCSGFIVRQLIFEQHRIFYYINNDTIHILTVIHHRQDINKRIEFLKDYLKNI